MPGGLFSSMSWQTTCPLDNSASGTTGSLQFSDLVIEEFDRRPLDLLLRVLFLLGLESELNKDLPVELVRLHSYSNISKLTVASRSHS